MLPLASRRHAIEPTLIGSYAVAVAMTTIVSTVAVGAIRRAREERLRCGVAKVRRMGLRGRWRG